LDTFKAYGAAWDAAFYKTVDVLEASYPSSAHELSELAYGPRSGQDLIAQAAQHILERRAEDDE
jgi:hypothetical protein